MTGFNHGVFRHYLRAARPVARGRAAHGGTLDALLQAVRDCPFVSRQATMLNVLSVAGPGRRELLSGLLRPQRAGVVRAAREPRYPAREMLRDTQMPAAIGRASASSSFLMPAG